MASCRLFFLLLRHRPGTTLFPYTTLFRSRSRTASRCSRASSARWACAWRRDRKSTRLNSSHRTISYAVFCLKKKKAWDAIADVTPGGDESLGVRVKWGDLLPSIPEGHNYL